MLKIKLELHFDNEAKACLLEAQDVYKYIGENTEKEVRLAYYIDMLCKYQNYFVFKNPNMANDDGEEWFLRGWINGYDYANKHLIKENENNIQIKGKGYLIEYSEPFKI